MVGTELANRGHDVSGLQYESGEVVDSFPIRRTSASEVYTPYWFGQWLFYRDWKPTIRSYLSKNAPDVVVTDRRCMVPTIAVAESLDIPAVGVVPGLGFTRFDPYDLGPDKRPSFIGAPKSVKLQYPFVKALFREHRTVLQEASRVVTISEFLRETLTKTFHCESELVRTPVRLDEVRANSVDPEYLTFVNPRSELKGADIVLALAAELPDEEFLIAGNFPGETYERRAQSMDNVTHLGWVDDMRDVYRRTKLILVPSLVEEGGGPRVVLEGFANGIPSVGTNRGAIPEHIGEAGATVSTPHDIGEWKGRISTVLQEYDEYADRASQSAGAYAVEGRITEFEQVLAEAVEG